MRLWRSKPSHPRRPGSRRVALAAVAGVAIVGTAAGVATAEVTAGTTTTSPQPGRAKASAPKPSNSRTAGRQPPVTRTAKLRTSCRSVAHIGDSTTVDLISSDSIPAKAQQLQARYADVGVRHLKLDASGGRSIVEALPHQVNGFDVARAWHQAGFRGCWVFALGTNDAANIAAGSNVGATARIDQMMAMAHGQPVLWVNTKTMLSSGPYSDANERAWDTALVKAQHRYPNLRIFNWAAKARPSWFLSDGIHYNSLGCVMRARAIANALARAFPKSFADNNT